MKNNGSEATVKMKRPADASAAQRFIGLGEGHCKECYLYFYRAVLYVPNPY